MGPLCFYLSIFANKTQLNINMGHNQAWAQSLNPAQCAVPTSKGKENVGTFGNTARTRVDNGGLKRFISADHQRLFDRVL